MNKQTEYFVCGGGYVQESFPPKPRKLALTRPTKGKPYVAETEKAGRQLFHLSKHHSHLYRLDVETGTATLLQRGECDARHESDSRGVSSPETFKVSDEDL